MSSGKEPLPIWRDHVFTSIYLELYLDVAEGGAEVPQLPALGEAFEFFHALLIDVQAAHPSDGAVRAASVLCAEAVRLHSPSFDTTAGQPFLDFLTAFVQRVRALKVGEAVLTPGFWDTGSGTFFVLGRTARGSEYSLAVCSAGHGARYHPSHPNVIDAVPTGR